MGKTSIEWTEQSWNPIGGCRKVSPGCKNCYAIRQARRMQGSPIVKIRTRYEGITVEGPNWSGATFIDDEVLREPLKTRKPTTYFISLSDLFYDQRPVEDIDRVFAVMALARWHKFLILTKYHDRMREYFKDLGYRQEVIGILAEGMSGLDRHFDGPGTAPGYGVTWRLPFKNVGLGVSLEDQQRADERIPLLLQTPAAVRFLSVEPLLGAVDLTRVRPGGCSGWIDAIGRREHRGPSIFSTEVGIDWAIVGGESGPGARPCDVAWIRSIKDQCQAAGVPVFVKQLGARPWDSASSEIDHLFSHCGHPCECCDECPSNEGQRDEKDHPQLLNLKAPKGGDPEEWPADLRVRELPAFLGGPA